MQIRDRVKELRRVAVAQLRPNPRNWRAHPPLQRDALRGLLAEIGFAGALLARELSDGSLELIDGHLRAETLPEAQLPVLVLDVDEAEADKLLALLDPLVSLAEAQPNALRDLLSSVETRNESINILLGKLAQQCGEPAVGAAKDSPPVVESYQVVVDCRDEPQQRELYEKLTAEGYRCRVLTL